MSKHAILASYTYQKRYGIVSSVDLCRCIAQRTTRRTTVMPLLDSQFKEIDSVFYIRYKTLL